MFPDGYHPLSIEENYELTGQPSTTREHSSPPKYYLLDLGFHGDTLLISALPMSHKFRAEINLSLSSKPPQNLEILFLQISTMLEI